ncbi:MAG: hypothetical protein ACJ748_15510, partial [Flavisolibacter sp.]
RALLADETMLIVGFMDMLDLPLGRQQRLDILHVLAREADRFTVEDVLLAAALLDRSSRSRIDGRSLTSEQAAEIQAGYVEQLLADDDPEVYRILAEAIAVRQPPPVVN